MLKWIIVALALLGLVMVLMSRTPAPEMLSGESGPFLGGTVTTWAEVSTDGNVSRVGLDIPMATIENAPTTVTGTESYQISLDFPELIQQKTFFNHIYLDYGPGGHPPLAYQVPHFDIHFYGTSKAERMVIDCTDERMPMESQVPSQYLVLPAGTGPDSGCVPQMGIHAVDLTSPELNPEAPQPFNKTMILGYYGGQFTFLEPMITREHLLMGKDFTMALRLPETLDRHTLYPTGFFADYDPAQQVYHLTWWGFESR